ncbi:MAG: hypothetical protein Q8R01_03545 [Ramlibacter sp.]|nr:hypothetical protein [Ramlibacter sp.]
MKKPQQAQDPGHPPPGVEQPSPEHGRDPIASPNPESAVLRQAFAFSDMGGHLHRQHFVIRTILPNIGNSMQRAQKPEREGQTSDDSRRRPQPPAWEDSSGEGAASALESLRKLEQSRRSNRPADDRPAAE